MPDPWEMDWDTTPVDESMEETFDRTLPGPEQVSGITGGVKPWEMDWGDDAPTIETLKSEEAFIDITNRWAQGLSHKILRGLTFGFSEHLPGIPEETKRNIARFEEDHPIMSGGAEVFGGLGTGVSSAKTVARYAPKVSQWITRKIPVWAQMATGGAAGTGVYAANLAEEGERAEAGTVGAVTGAIAGPVFGAAMRMALAAGAGTWQAIKRMLANTSERQAERILRAAMDAEDMSPEFIQRELDRLGPNAVLADVSESMARTLRGAAAMDHGSHGMANAFLKGRQTGQVGRLTQAAGVDDTFDAEEFARGYSRWLRSRETAAGDLYNEAYSASLEATDGLVDLMNRPSVKDAMNTAVRLIRESGEEVNDVRFFQYTKEALDDRIGALLKAGNRNEARLLIQTKNALLDEIDDQVPAYRDARNIYAGEQQLKDAAEMGYDVVKRQGEDLWIIEDAVSAMSESEAQAFRMGALRGIVDRLDRTREGRNVAATLIDSNRARQLLRLVFPDDETFQNFVRNADAESVFSGTKNVVTGGSPTARIDSDTDILKSAASMGQAARTSHDAVGLALNLFHELGISNPSPEALRIVTETLLSRQSNIASRAAARPVVQPDIVKAGPFGAAGGIAGENVREEGTE